MPRGRSSSSSRVSRILIPAIIVLLIAAAVVLLLVLHPWSKDPADPTVTSAPSPSPAVTDEAPADETPEPTATPEPTPTPEPSLPTPKPVDTSDAILPKQAEGYLPVFAAANTEKKQIAITVDDLWNADNVREILRVANENGAHLTFFPIGEAVKDHADLLREIHAGGHEIENHTWSHVNLYSLTAKEMVTEVAKQNLLISQALGVDYHQHFLRPRGGNSDYDLRMHRMLQQMGFVGVSHWSVSGTPDMKTWSGSLKSGDVILFHATDADMKKLVKLIPALVDAGYELVTLNGLYNLPDNATYPLGTTTIGTVEGLDFDAMEDIPYGGMLRNGDMSYTVQRLQRRLAELGYYEGKFDGEFGSGTQTAVTLFQTAVGLAPDGIAGEETQKALFSDDAPVYVPTTTKAP